MKIVKLTIAFLSTISIVISLTVLGKRWVDNSPLFIVRNIIIKGNESITEKNIISKINIKPETHIFDIDINKLKNRIKSNPFVKKVSTKRVFPSTIEIKIEEKNPVAFVISENSYTLVENIELLSIPEQRRVYDIPAITGIKDIEKRLKNNKSIEELKISYEMLTLMKKNKINLYDQISEIHFNNSDIITIYLNERTIPVYIKNDELYRKFYYFRQFLNYAQSNSLLQNVEYINLCYKDQIIIKE
jgi:cell division protein FtsQ